MTYTLINWETRVEFNCITGHCDATTRVLVQACDDNGFTKTFWFTLPSTSGEAT